MKLPESLLDIQTPALLLRKQPFASNLSAMADHCKSKDIALRPHAKTHKCGRVAMEQVRGGAVGICCATLSEAELLGDYVDSILITSPIVSDTLFLRARQLQNRIRELICVVDDESVVNRLALVFDKANPLNVLLDIDPGMHRTGTKANSHALSLAKKLHQSPSFEFRGLQCYAGNLMHIERVDERQTRTQSTWRALNDFKTKLKENRIPCPIVSGGGTGTYDIDWRSGLLTELQAGSYPFVDLEYMAIDWGDHDSCPFEQSLFVLSTIVSANTAGLATVDAGLKAFATESVAPTIASDNNPKATYKFRGDEHGALVFEDNQFQPSVSTQVLLNVPHCDPTINLYDEFLLVDDDWQLIDRWQIDARSGRRIGSV